MVFAVIVIQYVACINIVSDSPLVLTSRSRRGTRRREERKLKQLKEITQMMRERQLREEASPEEEAEEAPYTVDWEGILQGFVLGPLLFLGP